MSLTLDELRKAKAELDLELHQVLERFRERSGCTVVSVEVKVVRVRRILGPDVHLTRVAASLHTGL